MYDSEKVQGQSLTYMGHKAGDRVGAILDAKDGAVEFLGYGVYEGDFVPEGAAGWIAEDLRGIGATNPKIRLDSGKIVWGCECWWGSEKSVKKQLEGTIVKDIDIDEIRKKHKKNEASTKNKHSTK